MPNWTGNQLRITGSAKEIARFKKQARYTREDRSIEGKLVKTECEFCFEPFLPMPEQLMTMHSGCITIKGVQYDNWYTINGVDVGLTTEDKAGLIKKYGYKDWYERNCNVLGTKWDVDGVLECSRTTELGYTFQSAWAPPAEGILAVSEQYPELKFNLSFELEEGGGGEYTMKNGKVLEESSFKASAEEE